MGSSRILWNTMYTTQDYSYILPQELIAEVAVHPQHNARLMVIDKDSGTLQQETTFYHLDGILPSNRVIFFNNSKVLKARVSLHNITYKDSIWLSKSLVEGEIFYLKSNSEIEHEVLVRPGNKFKVGNMYTIGEFTVEITWMTSSWRVMKISKWYDNGIISEFLEKHWALPLPPYIKYDEEKEKDYQTSFAEKDWSVAAPTASLHFTHELLNKIKNEKKYITLHVWIGTFKPIDTKDIRNYEIHSETVEITLQTLIDIAELKIWWKKIVAVWTTACRTLESLPSLWKKIQNTIQHQLNDDVCAYWNNRIKDLDDNDWIHDAKYSEDWSIRFSTSIYITPWYAFKIVDDLITNFHLPESSLLVLVSAFTGYHSMMNIYQKAIEKKYRFYSFWDGMYIQWKP